MAEAEEAEAEARKQRRTLAEEQVVKAAAAAVVVQEKEEVAREDAAGRQAAVDTVYGPVGAGAIEVHSKTIGGSSQVLLVGQGDSLGAITARVAAAHGLDPSGLSLFSRGKRLEGQVRKTPSWPRSWANFSLLWLCSYWNAWANLHLLGQPNTFLAWVRLR